MIMLSRDKILKRVAEYFDDVEVSVFDSIDSTNSYAKGEFNGSPLIVLADTQTGGRGRLGRSFFSPSGTGLYMSIALKLPLAADTLTVIAAVAVCRAIGRFSDKKTEIKWVNDIFCGGKKVCGILCESISVTDGRADSAVIGIGINLSTDEFPDEISTVAGSLGLDKIDRNELAAQIYIELMYVLNMGKEAVLHEYETKLFILGKEVSFVKNSISYKGTATGINENGNLLIDVNGEIVALSSGEISLVSENFVK